jgi:formate/nitrite transporter FocA (FNT family)
MYQPYPGTAQLPGTQPRTVPQSVRQAVKAMYGGAAASLIYLVSSIATEGSTKTATEKRFPKLTASQVSTDQHVVLITGIVSGLIAIAAWIIIARASQAGKNWGRITGTVLFGLATLDAAGGLINPVAVPVKILAFVIWLFGLIAVVRLWQATSTAYFKAPRP